MLVGAVGDTLRIGCASRLAGGRNGIALVYQFQMAALSADVAELENHRAGQLALHIEIEIHRVGIGEVGVDDVDLERIELREVDRLSRRRAE